MRQRLAVVVLQLVIALQGAIVVTVAPAVPASPVRAAGACQVTQGAAGAGTVSACPEAESYADVADAMHVALDQARGAQATSPLSITSTPDGAKVLLNGLESGRTPLQTAVRAGSYLVRITKDGFQPFSTTVTVSPSHPGAVSARLQAEGGAGSYEWVRPETLIALAGGFPEGSFDITGYVRDKDGADYVSFQNSKEVVVTFEKPTEIHPDRQWLKSEQKTISMVGVARSTDDGRTWSLVKTWSGSYSARTWTSERFTDSIWLQGDPGPLKEHWMRAYYHEWQSEQYIVSSLVPRPEGGIAIYATRLVTHQPQEVMATWDNVPSDYCRPDDPEMEDCHRFKDLPGRYLATLHGPFTRSLTTDLGFTGTFRSGPTSDVVSRWGLNTTDLATYNLVREQTTTALETKTGAEPTIAGFAGLTYQGSHETDDYFLSIVRDCCTTDGSVYVTHAGGQPSLVTTYNLGADAPKGSNRFEELRIAPDGSLYILDHIRGGIYRLGDRGAELLGSVPPETYGGIYGVGTSSTSYLSAAIDSGGNVHVAFRVGNVPGGQPQSFRVYYELFAHDKVAFDGVALFTTAGCASCDAARDWLTKAGVPFRENPTDLPAAVATSVAAAVGSAGYPVLARLGADAVVVGAAEPATISRLLGIAYPIVVDTHAARVGKTDAGLFGYQPDWVLTVLEDDKPRIIVQRDEGVVSFEPSGGGAWTSTKLLDPPPPAPATPTSSDGSGIAFYPRYPLFPGGASTPSVGTARDVPFNTISKPGDLRFLNRVDPWGSYTLHTTKSPPTSSAYVASTAVSQLIPSGVFYVALGKGSAAAVQGDLAGYVTQQGVVEDGGDRFYRVVADLRAQNETATDGNITNRVIDGFITVETEVEGVPETRQVSLALLVNNTRLRVFDANVYGKARDVTVEAVHFTGADERWLITNNIALPNSIPCGPDQALLLDPHAISSFTAADVRSYELGSCLDALEVQPSVIADCKSWDDLKLVLAAETMDSLSQSMELSRSEGVTNYELSFGSRDATVHRIVSLDHEPSSGPTCISPTDGATAAVVRISGRILGGDERFTPDISIVDRGTAAVSTAATAEPGTLAWERDWLELEATFLEADLRTSIVNEALVPFLYLAPGAKRAGYRRQLVATRALLHCNLEGTGLTSVVAMIQRAGDDPEGLRRTGACLSDFLVNRTKHWATYDTTVWAEPANIGTVVNYALSANPTLAFLASAAKGEPADYGEFIIKRATDLEARAAADRDVRDLATDFALDHYARLATATARELGSSRGGLTRVFVLASDVERLSVRVIEDCARTFGTSNPFPKLIELTSSRSYRAGIPCVDRASSGPGRIEAYRRLSLGLRSGTFMAIFDAAGRDLDLLYSLLKTASAAIADVQAAEAQYPEGTAIGAWQPSLPPLARLVIIERHVQAIVAARGKQITVKEAAQVLAGLVECGWGLVMSIPIGLVMFAAGQAALWAGPGAAAVGGVLFLGTGVVFTKLAADELAQAWEDLDLTAKTAGLCGTAISAVMTLAAAVPTAHAVKAWRSAEALRKSPTKMIDTGAVINRGRAGGMPLDEQAAMLSPRGGEVGAEAVPPPQQPLEPELRPIIEAMPEGKKALAVDATRDLGYSQSSGAERSILRELLTEWRKPDGVKAAVARRLHEMNSLISAGAEPSSPEVMMWDDVGAAFIEEVAVGRPKSLVAEPAPASPAANGSPAKSARLVGRDAGLTKAAEGTPFKAPDVAPEIAAQRQVSLLNAFLNSDRVVAAVRSLAGKRALTAEEVSDLIKLDRAARPGSSDAFLHELGGTRIVDSLRAGVGEAVRLARAEGHEILNISSEYLGSGQSKSAFKVTVKLKGADPVEFVVAKGDIGIKEAEAYAKLGPKEITQRLLDPLLEKVDGDQSILITEFVPGRKVSSDYLQGFVELYEATAEPGYADALGRLDARIFARTTPEVGGIENGLYNTDLGLRNINVWLTKAGSWVARVVDFAGNYTREVDQDLYFGTSLLRRSRFNDEFTQGVKNYDAYLGGMVEQLASEPGWTRQRALGVLERARQNILTQAFQDRAADLQGPLLKEAKLANETAPLIEQFLAKQGPKALTWPMVQPWQLGQTARVPLVVPAAAWPGLIAVG
jgi:hypothetical protein